jgi:hypothetical protein
MKKICWHTAGKYTVPILWDKKEKTIVNNESSEIMRMFNRYRWQLLSACFAHYGGMQPCLLASFLPSFPAGVWVLPQVML